MQGSPMRATARPPFAIRDRSGSRSRTPLRRLEFLGTMRARVARVSGQLFDDVRVGSGGDVKFLCDRCKTRYSIGDDRVRGKILKIRCKNCANVITVREGMTADEALPDRRMRPTT